MRPFKVQSGHPGVLWDQHSNKWKAIFSRSRCRTYLGLHPTVESAVAALAEAEEILSYNVKPEQVTP